MILYLNRSLFSRSRHLYSFSRQSERRAAAGPRHCGGVAPGFLEEVQNILRAKKHQ